MEHVSNTDIQIIKQWLGTGSINIFGLPFSGKDTHGHQLAELFGTSLISGGDILRNSAIPDAARRIMEAGGLVPTDDFIRIVTPYLSHQKFVGKPLILSTVGRWHGEEPGVIGAAEAAGHPIKAVVYLVTNEATAKERHAASHEDEARGIRADDAEHVLETRFAEFRNKTIPVIDFYREKGLLIEVDGNPPKDEVHIAILRGLLEFANRASASQ